MYDIHRKRTHVFQHQSIQTLCCSFNDVNKRETKPQMCNKSEMNNNWNYLLDISDEIYL